MKDKSTFQAANTHLLERLDRPGPKRILALDGGGIRGALTLGFLERMENILRARHGGDPDFRLCDYFDLIGGTSTGSIIATGLAIGMSATEIKNQYLELGGKIFGTKYWKWKAFSRGAAYDHLPLEKALRGVVGEDTTLDDPLVKTGLSIIAKRAETYSIWAVYNHPRNKYLQHNGHLKLWELCRASSAAPTYFEPKVLNVNPPGGPEQHAAFIDGGVSSFNNPALQLFMLATLKGYCFDWSVGEDNLMIVSVGTGMYNHKYDHKKYALKNLLGWAKAIPNLLMEDASFLNQAMLQAISNSPTAVNLDGHIGNMKNDLLTPEPMLTYLRYNGILEKDKLDALGFNFSQEHVESMREMDRSQHRFELAEIGEKEAMEQVKEAHFPAAFDLKV